MLKAENLTITYNNKDIIINKANFKINEGDFVFLTGISGSGKTSIIRAINGEIKAKGKLLIGPYNIPTVKKSTLAKIRRRLGVVFQDYKLIPEWNILKNVMLPLIIIGYDKKASEKRAMEILQKVKLSHKIDKYPFELSGGEQQRVAIARAIIHNPVMILADEPISGLDEYSANLVMDLFKMANNRGISVLVASHSLPSDFSFEYRHLRIEKGKVYELS